jgi:hypothetical protein
MPIIFMDLIRREDLRAHPDWLFVFGDNFARMGFGGLARVCRGEPNAVGIPTKRMPSNVQGAFLADGDLKMWRIVSGPDLLRIERALEEGVTVVLSSAGVGTGLAQLETKAPVIWDELQTWLDSIKRIDDDRES